MSKTLFIVLLFFSGACGLVYEILWVRMFTTMLGNTYFAISTVVASFMAGIFIGSWLVGRVKIWLRDALRSYGLIEISIGVYGFVLLAVFESIEGLDAMAHGALGNAETLLQLLSITETFLLLVVPTSAMGATLPIAVHYFTKNLNHFRGNISLFYAVNTVGGAFGAFIAGFVLLEHLGVRQSLMLTALINLAIGATVLWTSRSTGGIVVSETSFPTTKHSPKEVHGSTDSRLNSFYLGVAALSGFVALSCEVTWARGLQFLTHNSTYGFSVILFIFLIGIALGSFIATRLTKRSHALDAIYGRLQLGLGLSVLLTIYLLYSFVYSDAFQKNVIEVLYDYSYNWLWGIGVYVAVCVLMFLIPSTFMGVSFPLLNHLYFERAGGLPGGAVGAVYAANTIGSVAGSLAAGFLLIPLIGIRATILAASVLSLLVGTAFILRSNSSKTVPLGATVFIGCILFAISLEGTHLYGRNESPRDRVLFYEEGLMATVKVFDRSRDRSMSIDGITIASTGRSLLKKEKVIAHLPFLIQPDLRNALAVGLASGISVGSMTLHPSVEQIDCVELIKPVFPASELFSDHNFDLSKHPKVRLYYDDVYAHLRHTSTRYDLISSDGKLSPLSAGNTIMLSREYYELCRTRMTDHGLFIQWVPLTTPHDELQIILKTLKHSFRYVLLFVVYPSDIFMVASDAFMVLDRTNLENVLGDETIKSDLQIAGLQEADAVLSSCLGTWDMELDASMPVNSFDRPVLEFTYMRHWKEGRRWPGGYRARNLEFLADYYETRGTLILPEVFRDVEGTEIAEISQGAKLFFRSAVKYFQTGDFSSSFVSYLEYRKTKQAPGLTEEERTNIGDAESGE